MNDSAKVSFGDIIDVRFVVLMLILMIGGVIGGIYLAGGPERLKHAIFDNREQECSKLPAIQSLLLKHDNSTFRYRGAFGGGTCVVDLEDGTFISVEYPYNR